MRVLVTGGAGFIGSNLVRELVERGHEPGVLDDLSTGSEDNLPGDVDFLEMDILDPGLEGAMLEFGPDAVVHLAAQADVQASMADPDHDWAVNVEGTRAVARAAVACGATRVLSASSAAVYGDPAVLPLAETSPKSPANPYGRSKLAAEAALAEACAGSGTDAASFRFSNVYGPRQDWRGEGGVVAIFAARLASGRPPAIFGDGRQTRDFIFVLDVADAIIAALESVSPLAGPLPDGGAYNISTGIETSVLDLTSGLERVAAVRLPPEHRPARAGDILRSALDPSKAAATLGWEARRPLAQGLAETWRWFAEAR